MTVNRLMQYQYLTREQLNGFDNYKYSSRDTSPLSVYVMHPFWNWLVQFFPSSFAPNLMTFLGFLCTVINFVLFSYYDWNFNSTNDLPDKTHIPRWVWLCAAINIFLAYTLDGIDGKQARRIGLAGPLGELFDHGLDSYTAVLIPTCLYSIFGRSAEYSAVPMRMYIVCWMVFFNFYVSHWEKYNTGVLYLPWGYDLSMWGSTAMYFITWWYGHNFWRRHLPFGNWTLGNIMEVAMHISAFANMPMVIINVYNSYVERTGKMRSFSEAMRPLWPFLTFVILLIWWPLVSPTNIMETDPRALFLLSGTIFSNISCRLIVAQMSNTRTECFHWMTPIYFLCILIGLWLPNLERFILYLLLVATTLTHWHYGTQVVKQMCDHFNRICFSVKMRSKTDNINNIKASTTETSTAESFIEQKMQ